MLLLSLLNDFRVLMHHHHQRSKKQKYLHGTIMSVKEKCFCDLGELTHEEQANWFRSAGKYQHA